MCVCVRERDRTRERLNIKIDNAEDSKDPASSQLTYPAFSQVIPYIRHPSDLNS